MIDVPMRPGSASRCRVWLDELPDAMFDISDKIIQVMPIETASVSTMRSAAIELWIAAGPRQHYGLLGGTFQPQADDRYVVSIATTATSSVLWEKPFGGTSSFVGLLDEFAAGVSEGISSRPALGIGVLLIDCAAYDLASSSHNMFRQLAKLLLSLLALPDHPPISLLTDLAVHWADA